MFCLTVPTNFLGEHFSISENFGYRKILCIRRGHHYFPLNIFCFTVPIKFVGEPFCVSKKFWYRKFSCIERGALRFSRSFFVPHSAEKIRWGTLQCFRKFRVSKNFTHKKGLSLFSVDFLSFSADKICRGALLCFKKILVSKIFK